MIQIESATANRPGLVALEPSDREPVARLFGRLSAESVYRRFFSPVLWPEQFATAVLRVDQRDRVAVAAVEDGEIVGIAQYARSKGRSEAERGTTPPLPANAGMVRGLLPPEPALADLAIVVADAWQKQGIGTRLVAALADRALSNGITAFAVDVQGDNDASIRLLRRVAPGIRLAFSAGVGEGSFPLTASEDV